MTVVGHIVLLPVYIILTILVRANRPDSAAYEKNKAAADRSREALAEIDGRIDALRQKASALANKNEGLKQNCYSAAKR